MCRRLFKKKEIEENQSVLCSWEWLFDLRREAQEALVLCCGRSVGVSVRKEWCCGTAAACSAPLPPPPPMMG